MKMIALQLDLARQKESVNFVKSYVDFAKKSGYNTIFLYLETCVRTADTPFFDPDETYSFDEMKEIVGYIEGQGLTAVPAFENFYHVEKLLCYDEVAEFAEFPDEKLRAEAGRRPCIKGARSGAFQIRRSTHFSISTYPTYARCFTGNTSTWGWTKFSSSANARVAAKG